MTWNLNRIGAKNPDEVDLDLLFLHSSSCFCERILGFIHLSSVSQPVRPIAMNESSPMESMLIETMCFMVNPIVR